MGLKTRGKFVFQCQVRRNEDEVTLKIRRFPMLTDDSQFFVTYEIGGQGPQLVSKTRIQESNEEMTIIELKTDSSWNVRSHYSAKGMPTTMSA